MPDIFISDKKEKKDEPVLEKVGSEINEFQEETVEDLGKTVGKIEKGIPKILSSKILSSFIVRPRRVHFEAKEQEEKVVLLLRQHPITNLKWIIPFIALIIAPIITKAFPIFDFMPASFQAVGLMAWYLVAFSYGFQGFLGWYFNVYLVTDERIIDIDFHNLIYKEISDANIDKIQDVTYRMGGVIRTIFNYGDILIQTASEKANFEFSAVPKPDKVVKILQELRLEERQEELEGRIR